MLVIMLVVLSIAFAVGWIYSKFSRVPHQQVELAAKKYGMEMQMETAKELRSVAFNKAVEQLANMNREEQKTFLDFLEAIIGPFDNQDDGKSTGDSGIGTGGFQRVDRPTDAKAAGALKPAAQDPESGDQDNAVTQARKSVRLELLNMGLNEPTVNKIVGNHDRFVRFCNAFKKHLPYY